MEPLRYTVTEECTVRHVLTEVFLMSHSHISRLKRRPGGILLRGVPCYTTSRCNIGDEVTALISDPPETKRLEPMEADIPIAYEDEWLAVVDKPAGMTVHPERAGMGGSVENALSAHFKEDEFVHTVSRLDRGTSGLMTAAKSGYVHERMIRLLHTPDFIKEYVALAEGVLEDDSGDIDLPLAHPEGSNYMMRVTPGGMESHTSYEVLRRMNGMTLIKLIPHTGRMHQLRVHMAAIGHPLVGDWLYGKESPDITHAALHSYRLAFTHPMTGKRVELTAELPEEIKKLITEN